jgi:phage terminase Nu1 subunit (DNA packaging protein)
MTTQRPKRTGTKYPTIDTTHVSQTSTSAVFGTSRLTLGEWEERGCPRNADGTYDLAAVFAWRVAEIEERISTARDRLAGHRARREAALAERAEMELAELKGDLLSRQAVVGGWVARFRTLATMLETVIRRCRANGFPPEHVTTLEGEVDAMLSELRRPQVALKLTAAEAAILAPTEKGAAK